MKILMHKDRKTHHVWTAVFMFCCLATGQIVKGDIQNDKHVLLNLKSHIAHHAEYYDQDLFAAWNPKDNSPCKWPQISCDVQGNHVTVIDLSYCTSSVLFFGNFSALPQLTHLYLSGNNISGPIPDDLEKCRNLRALDLSGNYNIGCGFNLSGLDSLEVLDLSDNNISCSFQTLIPAISCRKLEVLNLSKNKLAGPIGNLPNSCKKLSSLDLSSNRLSGDLQFSVRSFVEFSVSGNNFGGALSGSSTFSENCSLRVLELSENLFLGDVDKELSNCKDLVMLNLSGNRFSGKMPSNIGSELKILVLANNLFTGNIPAEYGGLVKLQILDLSFNKLNGSIPSSFGKLVSLLWLMLAKNSLTGEIPVELGNCSSLLWLNLAENRLSGTIPDELYSIGTNTTPVFVSNRLNPTAIKFTSCRTYNRWVQDSYLDSDISDCDVEWSYLLRGIGLFPWRMGYIKLSDNNLSGELTHEISRMQNFSKLYLDNNRINGKLPPEVAFLPLQALNVSKNMLSGEIPEEISNMISVTSLDLSYNNLSGEFPKGLLYMTNLGRFNISYNPYIYSREPYTEQLARFGENSYIGDPLLSREPDVTVQSSSTSPARGEDQGKLQGLIGEFIFAFIVSYTPFFVLSFLFALFRGLNKDSMATKRMRQRQRRRV